MSDGRYHEVPGRDFFDTVRFFLSKIVPQWDGQIPDEKNVIVEVG